MKDLLWAKTTKRKRAQHWDCDTRKMAFFHSRTVVVVLLILLTRNQVYSSDLDQELSVTLAMNQQALTEQCSASAHHSQALSQLLKTLEQSQQPNSQGISQAVVQMAQAITQLSQDLSPLIQLNKELATDQSSSLTKLVQVAEETKASQSQMAQEMKAFLSQMAQEMRTFRDQLEESIAYQRDTAEELVETLTIHLKPTSETATTSALQEISLTLRLLALRSGLSGSVQLVSDGNFIAVKEKKTWQDAKTSCQEMGGYLASPPSDFEAFQTFVFNAIGGRFAWLGGREQGSEGYKFLDGTQVRPEHWLPGQPNDPNGCLRIDAGANPPYVDGRCSATAFYICRFD